MHEISGKCPCPVRMFLICLINSHAVATYQAGDRFHITSSLYLQIFFTFSPFCYMLHINIQYKHWRKTGLNSKGERICKTSGLGIKSEAHVCMILVRCIKTTGAPKYYLHHRYLLRVLFKMSLNLFFAFLNDCSILIKKIQWHS